MGRDLPKRLIECKFRDALAILLDGKTEVSLHSGKADIVTSTHVYEVKRCRQWKHAIGQALVYASEVGLHPGVALFGWSPTEEIIQVIGEACSRLHIDLLFHFFDDDSDMVYSGNMACFTRIPKPLNLPDMSFKMIVRPWEIPQRFRKGRM